jgi:hypothetical protein
VRPPNVICNPDPYGANGAGRPPNALENCIVVPGDLPRNKFPKVPLRRMLVADPVPSVVLVYARNTFPIDTDKPVAGIAINCPVDSCGLTNYLSFFLVYKFFVEYILL